jgi:competence protein ComEC
MIFIGKPLAAGRRRWLAYAFAAECAITPLTLFHFHQYALGGSLTTLALTPVVSAMLIVCALICAFPIVPLFRLIGLLHGICSILNGASATLAGWYASPTIASLVIGFGAATLAIAFLRARTRAIVMMVCACIPIASAIVRAHHRVDRPTMTILDVGQGDSILIRTHDRTMLVDAGPKFADVASMLLDRGVRSIDAVYLTHVHPDHCGGIPDVMTHLRVRALWISPRRFQGDCAQRLLEIASTELVPIHLVRDGRRTFRRSAENNSSLVLRVRMDSRIVLLTGDIEKETESDLADRIGRADVLKVAHHGSRSSSTAAFLGAVRPSIALISCGRHNLFGHPHAEVLQSLRDRGIRVYRTDVNGSIDLEFDSGHIFVRRQIDTPR